MPTRPRRPTKYIEFYFTLDDRITLTRFLLFRQDAIFRVDYKGEKRQMIRRNLPSPKGLAILGNDIYWVDRNLGNIYKSSKLASDTSPPQVVKTGN